MLGRNEIEFLMWFIELPYFSLRIEIAIELNEYLTVIKGFSVQTKNTFDRFDVTLCGNRCQNVGYRKAYYLCNRHFDAGLKKQANFQI